MYLSFNCYIHMYMYFLLLFSCLRPTTPLLLCSTFHSAMKLIDGTKENPSLLGSCVDFLEAWLKLAEKLADSRSILYSPHAIPLPPTTHADEIQPMYHPLFNPLSFVVRAQQVRDSDRSKMGRRISLVLLRGRREEGREREREREREGERERERERERFGGGGGWGSEREGVEMGHCYSKYMYTILSPS